MKELSRKKPSNKEASNKELAAKQPTELIPAELTPAEKSKIEKNIRRSLLELLETRPYKKINVSDITAHADIARQTFYCYFRSKDELLLSFMDDIYDEFYQEIEDFIALDIHSTNAINEKVYAIWGREKTMAKKILTAGLDEQIYSRFRRYVARGMGRIMIKLELQVIEPKLLEYYIDLVAGSTFHVMKHWIQDDMPYSPAEMSKIYVYFNNSDIMSAFSAPKGANKSDKTHKILSAPSHETSAVL